MTQSKTAVAKRAAPTDVVTFSEEQVKLLSRTIAENATSDELALFVGQCKRTGLDPFTRQIYFIKGKPGKNGQPGKVSIVVSIDGFRLVASRSKQYRGQTKVEWCGADGVWKDVWIEEGSPAAARVGVHRDGFAEPLYGVATFKESASWKDEWVNGQKTGKRVLNDQWAIRGAHMLAKVAEALALRKAFPNDLSGLYTNDEIADEHSEPTVVQTITAEPKPAPKPEFTCEHCAKAGRHVPVTDSEASKSVEVTGGKVFCSESLQAWQKARVQRPQNGSGAGGAGQATDEPFLTVQARPTKPERQPAPTASTTTGEAKPGNKIDLIQSYRRQFAEAKTAEDVRFVFDASALDRDVNGSPMLQGAIKGLAKDRLSELKAPPAEPGACEDCNGTGKVHDGNECRKCNGLGVR